MGSLLDAGWKLEIERLQNDHTPVAPAVTVVELKNLARTISKISLSPVRDAYIELIHRIRHAGIEVSDRRAVKLLENGGRFGPVVRPDGDAPERPVGAALYLGQRGPDRDADADRHQRD